MKSASQKRRLLAAACIALPLLAACGGDGNGKSPAPAPAPSVSPVLKSTTYGQVEGVDSSATSGTYSWKGIPFAKPPVGDLRWKAPVDPDAWTTAKAAKEYGNACAQYGRIYGPGTNNRYDETIGTTLNQAVGSEDCLYLNIWRPATTDTNLPVIVFFHGGSNVSGYTADPVYDGANLAKAANAVVITPNFRLGILGFLAVPQLKTGTDAATDSGNFAILDSIKALQFINKNIASFGGNPANVTIMGQSAGAINVYALMTSPMMVAANPKLFHKVVPMSGGLSLASNLPAGSIPTMSPATTYDLQGTTLLQQLVIADNLAVDTATANAYIAGRSATQIAEYMRSKTPAVLFNTLLTRLPALAGSGPIPEGTAVPTDAIAAINAGNYVKAPVMAGNTRDEGKLFPSFLPLVGGAANARIVSDAQLFSTQLNYNPEAAPAISISDWIHASYLPVNTPTTGFTARAHQLNTVFFLASRDNILDALKAKQSEVWYYQFNWDKQPAPWNDIYGAAHLFDLPFMFGNFGPSLMSNIMNTNANRGGRLALSDTMMKSLGAFAKNGNPNDAALGVTWNAWPQKLIFDATLTDKAISVQ
ncbi:MAG TPA: carboxylesterase family protein [Noviherbaspirillum sp.]|jgi:para-nitrobenzyl esterase|uniref:carboxylesterase/lipase family protein n=1 Tax=Noviherbaspirillum sp. TaxID=1926288 RepID=UPI002F932E14